MRMLLTSALIVLLTACSGQPIDRESLDNTDYKTTLISAANFKSDPRFSSYFEDAVAYALFPRIVRAGAGFGAAYGSGWVFRQGSEPVAKVFVWQINAGPHIGAQIYQQILFFKNEKALSRFQRGTLEFAGQANLTFVTAGVSATPSYNNSVAVFTIIDGGLMLEGSIGGHRYDYRPIE